jgi:hypothetical protein
MEISNPGLPIVIPAYQRPEKILSRYSEVKEWTRFTSLNISIDGLRPKSDDDELMRRAKVIEIAEEIASSDNRVNVWVWSENPGVNDHIARIFSKMKNSDGLIVIEDDVGVNEVAMNFLQDNVNLDGSLASTAHVANCHLHLNPSSSRASVFPNQWGLAVAKPVMESYLDIIKGKKIERLSVSKLFHRTFGDYLSRLQIQRLVQWWFNHFFFCERHGNWADALIQYSVYANGGFYRVPARSLIVDDNALYDSRSMHQRESYEQVIFCEQAQMVPQSDFYTCVSCEIRGSRLEEASIRNLIGATKHRKYLQLWAR